VSERPRPARTGGEVQISGHAQVQVGRDFVVGNKIEQTAGTQELAALLSNLSAAVAESRSLSDPQRRELLSARTQLEAELVRDKPNGRKLQRLRAAFDAYGGEIASAATAVFNYPPVYDTLKSAMQRLLGG
jgi:uncharacterized protein (DUF1800 family)